MSQIIVYVLGGDVHVKPPSKCLNISLITFMKLLEIHTVQFHQMIGLSISFDNMVKKVK